MDLWLYIKALSGYWWALMSCALFTLLGTYVLLAKKSNQWAVWATVGVAVFCVLVAGYLAWSAEHSALVTLQERLSAPEFKMSIGSAWWGQNVHNLQMTMGVEIENPVGPPSAAVNWQVRLQFASRAIVGEVPIPSAEDIKIGIEGRKEKLVLKSADFLPKKAATPVPTGGTSSGWILVIFKNLPSDDIYQYKPTLIISCEDVVKHKLHESKMILGSKKGVTIPGK